MTRYYVYFIKSEPESRFVAFGRTKRLGERYKAYKVHCPNPQLVGLIRVETQTELNELERQIPKILSKDRYCDEFLYDTPEVREFYTQSTNVDIAETLNTEIQIFKAYQHEYRQDPEYKQHKREYNWKYNQDPKIKERKREWKRERYQNDPEYREREKKYHRGRYQNDPEYREQRREYAQRPENKELHNERQRKRRQRTEVKASDREYQQEYEQRPEVKERRRKQEQERCRKRRQDPEYKQRKRESDRKRYLQNKAEREG